MWEKEKNRDDIFRVCDTKALQGVHEDPAAERFLRRKRFCGRLER